MRRGAVALVLALLLILALLRVGAWLRETDVRIPTGTVFFPAGSGRMAAQASGPVNGPLVVIVHGTAAWSGFWKDVANHLAERGFRVIAVDLPPFGWSDRDPAARYDRITQAERLAAMVRAQREPAIVLGHSFGAGAVTELALRHPEQVRGLVLVDAALGELDPAGESAAAMVFSIKPVAELTTSATITNPDALGPIVRSLLARKASAAPWLPILREPMRRTGATPAYAAWLPSLFTKQDGALSRRSANLRGIRVPVALIWGRDDTVTPLAQGKKIAALTRARYFAVVPGVGHIPHIEDPVAFDGALDGALISITEGAR